MKLIILSDYGIDDAVAAIHLLKNKDMFSGVDIVAIAGNTSAENSLSNLKKLLYNCEMELDNVRAVSSVAIKQKYSHLATIHGVDGLGDLFDDVATWVVPVLEFSEWEKTVTGDEVLLSLGPCAITKLLLEKHKNMKCVLMAGVVSEKPNYFGYEFNQALDIDAFNYCVKENCVVATLDTCQKSSLDFASNNYQAEGILKVLIERAKQLALKRQNENCFICDFVASLYLTNKSDFIVQKNIDRWGNEINELVYLK